MASFSAPVAVTKTKSVFSIMRRARVTGFLMLVRSPVAPAMRVFPSIMLASISMRLSMVSVEPSPALNVGLSSMVLTAASTASRAVPPVFRMSNPVLAAVLAPVIPGFLRSGCHAPAPPWITITGFCIGCDTCLCCVVVGRRRYGVG